MHRTFVHEFGFNFMLPACIEIMPIEGKSGEFFEVGLGRPCGEVGSDAARVNIKWQVLAVGFKGSFPRLVDRPFGIDQDAVEVKDD